jgi:anti-sigma factor ChrR (cupin superfamily)
MRVPPDAVAELAALYIAGALSPADTATVEAHLAAQDADWIAAVADLQLPLHHLAASVPPITPPAHLRHRLLERVQAETVAPPAGMVFRYAQNARWADSGLPGIRFRPLSIDVPNQRLTALIQMQPGARYPGHAHDGIEECLVLAGELRVGNALMRTGDYQRAEPGSHHAEQVAVTECTLLLLAPLGPYAWAARLLRS